MGGGAGGAFSQVFGPVLVFCSSLSFLKLVLETFSPEISWKLHQLLARGFLPPGGEAADEFRRAGLLSAPKGPTGSPRTWGPPRGCVGLPCPARPRGEPNPTFGRRSLGPSGGARAETRAPQPWVSEERPSSRVGSNTPGGVYPPRPPAGGAQARSAVHFPDSTLFWERGVHDTSALGRAGSLVAVACGHHAKRPAGPRYVRQTNPKTV